MKPDLRALVVAALAFVSSGCAFPFMREAPPIAPSPEISSLPTPRSAPSWAPVPPGARIAPTITCPLWVRPNPEVLDHPVPPLVLRDWGDHQEFTYRGLRVAIGMSPDPHEPDLVLTTGTTTSTTFTTYVWTSDAGPGNPFARSKHGFTGLVRVLGAGRDTTEIQVICRSSG